MELNKVVLEGVLEQIKTEIKDLAEIYDSRDLFGIAYAKYSDKIIEIIDNYMK